MCRFRGINVCPSWFASVLNNPLRRWLHRPEAILGGLVLSGFTVVELGCGSGPFTVPLAKMVGPAGRVIAADVQPAMLAKVRKRVAQSGVQDRVELHPCFQFAVIKRAFISFDSDTGFTRDADVPRL